jgi:hypothetical protein
MGGCWKRSTVKTRKNIYLDAPKRPVKINPKYRLAYILPRPDLDRPTFDFFLPSAIELPPKAASDLTTTSAPPTIPQHCSS